MIRVLVNIPFMPTDKYFQRASARQIEETCNVLNRVTVYLLAVNYVICISIGIHSKKINYLVIDIHP